MAEQEKDFQHEADFLAALLEHDDVPQDMRDYISTTVMEFQGEVSLYTPAVLRVVWPLIRRQERTSGDALWQSVIIALRTFADEEADHLLSEINEATRAAEKQAAGQNGLTEVAEHLTAILAHPETPATLGNAIAEELTNMSSSIDYHTPDMIRRTLEAARQRELAEEGSEDDEQS